MVENKKLKIDLVFQSFAPLFLILCVKHAHCYWNSLPQLTAKYKIQGCSMIFTVFVNPYFGDFLIFIISLIWILKATLSYFGFLGILRIKFDSRGEKINNVTLKSDSGAVFLVTFVLPLLFDNINTLRGFIVFLLSLLTMFIVIYHSNLFYQNPVLTMLGYKTFEFQFLNPYSDIENPNATYIGITKGKMLKDDDAIRRKFIADNVFIVFKNSQEEKH